ncbi:hypothetical protein [Paenibacillus zanthoxyli]|uniref:hypothetical protein n=1 Tax=Paenibacillus zanthoxyli TaxID=369399 RepID=UPI0004708370|nr:hypothetical protein [Paenibacillus zanthoxyli]
MKKRIKLGISSLFLAGILLSSSVYAQDVMTPKTNPMSAEEQQAFDSSVVNGDIADALTLDP